MGQVEDKIVQFGITSNCKNKNIVKRDGKMGELSLCQTNLSCIAKEQCYPLSEGVKKESSLPCCDKSN